MKLFTFVYCLSIVSALVAAPTANEDFVISEIAAATNGVTRFVGSSLEALSTRLANAAQASTNYTDAAANALSQSKADKTKTVVVTETEEGDFWIDLYNNRILKLVEGSNPKTWSVGGTNDYPRLEFIESISNYHAYNSAGQVATFPPLGFTGNETALPSDYMAHRNMGVDQLARSFAYMSKTTGRSGMEGFYKTIDELGKIPDVAQRSQAAMQVFGRSGYELMPLINAADTTVDALQTVVSAMPSIPQSAANAGDAVGDAMGFAANQLKSIWLQGIGVVCGWFDNEYTGGVREASLRAGNYMEYYARLAVTKCLTWFGKLQNYLKRYGDYWGALIGAKLGGGSWSEALQSASSAWDQALREFDDVAAELEQKEQRRTERFKRQLEDRAIAIGKFQRAYNNAAITLDKRKERDAARELDVARQTRISCAFQEGRGGPDAERYFDDPEWRRFWHRAGLRDIPRAYVHNERMVIDPYFVEYVNAYLDEWAKSAYYTGLVKLMQGKRDIRFEGANRK